MNNWQPINTAPKDRRILLALDGGFVMIGKCFSKNDAFISSYGAYISDTILAWQELPVFDGVIAE